MMKFSNKRDSTSSSNTNSLDSKYALMQDVLKQLTDDQLAEFRDVFSSTPRVMES